MAWAMEPRPIPAKRAYRRRRHVAQRGLLEGEDGRGLARLRAVRRSRVDYRRGEVIRQAAPDGA
jgi:hypothetical protein